MKKTAKVLAAAMLTVLILLSGCGGNGSHAGAPAIVDGVVYFGAGGGTLIGLDLHTGREVWKFDASQ